MKGFALTLDLVFSLLIFVALIYFIGGVWNTLIEELEHQDRDILFTRAQQTLTLIMQESGTNHNLDYSKLLFFIEQTNKNYTNTKNRLGLGDSEYKFLIKDLDGNLIDESNMTLSGLNVVKTIRYGYTDQPVTLELWVWK